MPKVSVVIPIYNVEKYIEACLVSAINQTLKDIEIICVNDGTPDKSMDIVKKYAKNDKRIKIVNKRNGGQATARNKGINLATGKYLYFLDSDDTIKQDALEVLYKRLEKDNLDTLYFDAESIYENETLNKKHDKFSNYYVRSHKYPGVMTGQKMYAKMTDNGEYRTSPCLQINRLDFIKNNKIYFIEGIVHEDEYFGIKVCLLSQRCAYINKKLYIRLVREGSTMTSTQEIKRSIGYAKTVSEVAPLVAKNVLPEYTNYFLKYVLSLQNSAIKYYRDARKKNPNETQKFIKGLSTPDYVNFKLLTDKSIHTLDQLDKLKAAKKIRHIVSRSKRKVNNLLAKIRRVRDPKVFISIIIPVYNVKDYIEQCLDSLLSQSLKEIEIILVDDESTDGTYEICQEYASQDPRVIVLRQKHSNAGNARNLGMQHASGKFYLFLDSDDFFEKDLCKDSYHYANYFDADILFFAAYRYDQQTGEKEVYPTLLEPSLTPIRQVFKPDDVKDHLYHISSAAPWSKLFKACFVKKNKLQFQSLPNSNDVYFTRSAMALAKKLYAINKPLVNYRVNHGNNTQHNKYRNPLSFIEAYKAVNARLKEANLFDKYYKAYLNVLIGEIVYNYNSTKSDEAKQEILDYLKTKGLKELDLDNIDPKLVYNRSKYRLYKEIMK